MTNTLLAAALDDPFPSAHAREASTLERLLANLKVASDAFDARLAALPQTRACARHPEQTAMLDVDRSWQAKEPFYDCPACAAERRVRRNLARAREAGVPADVQHATLENFEVGRPAVATHLNPPQEFVEAAHALLSGRVRNGLLCGSPGIGKGHLAGAIAMHVIDADDDVAWIDCAGLFNLYHEAYAGGPPASQLLQRYASPRLLVLDEVALRDLPRDGEEILFAILDRRHKAERQTLLLSNKPGPAIKAWLGERIYDRLKSGGCLYRYGEWESMRGTGHDGSGGF